MTGPTYTSLVGYREHVLSGKATSQRNRILACLFEADRPLNRRQISVITGIAINAVTGRVNAMLPDEEKGHPGLVRVVYETDDPETGAKAVEYLEPVWPQPVQRELELDLEVK